MLDSMWTSTHSDIIVAKDSDQIDVIYYVERDHTLVPYEDAFRTLSYVSDQEYSEMIGLQVIHKIKRKFTLMFINYAFR